MAQLDAVKVVSKLLKEVRNVTPSQKLKDSLMAPHVFQLIDKYKVTDAQLCKKKNEMLFIADTYRCYLESSRRYKDILEKYHTKGERTVKQTADMVGFKLPHDPK